MFTEFYSRERVEGTYLFIDCSVDFVRRSMLQGADYVKYLSMQKGGKSWVDKRNSVAVAFCKNCQGIFTMSQWLRNDLIENIKDIELHIAGVEMPNDDDRLPGVVYHGILEYGDILKLYNYCDFFVMPSCFEAYGLVFVEALVFGLPCIGANRFAMPEFIQHGKNGYLTKEDTPEELAHYMELMICNRETLCRYIKDKQGKYIRQYDWIEVVNRILDVMRKDGYLTE